MDIALTFMYLICFMLQLYMMLDSGSLLNAVAASVWLACAILQIVRWRY